MAHLIELETFVDERGSLSVIDDAQSVLPFKIKRVFYIYNIDESQRGGHRHHKTIQAAICINGSCTVSCDNGKEKKVFKLDSANKCLIIDSEDWHIMENFLKGSILLVFASEKYDYKDYIFEPYEN